jgi:preprotein translocase subunit SecY
VIKTLVNAWKIADLRKKILFTVFILFLFRLGCAIPVPFIDITGEGIAGNQQGTFLNYLSMMTGDAFNYGRVFALGITPYINSSIILQLLAVAIPALEKLSHDEEGRKKMATITRYVTIGLAVLQGIAYYVYIWSQGDMLTKNKDGVAYTGFGAVFQGIVIVSVLTAGSALVMWLGEQINDKGIGNGISLILFAGIVSRVPTMVSAARSYILTAENAGLAWLYMALLVLGMLLLIILIVHVSAAERRIPVQYAKRQVGRKMYGGQASTLPMKVNMSGVLPIIFAQSIASLPATIAAFLPAPAEGSFGAAFLNAIDTRSVLYLFVYFLMIIGFSYFYATIQFNPVEISNNLKRQGGFIPGFRPGKPTSDFIAKVLSKVTLFGAIYLGIVAIAPLIVGKAINNNALAIGGTSVIIVVGVALETVQALENQMLMRQYKGFLE